MKILVVNYEYPPVGGGGGSCCREIVMRLANKGHRIDVFTAGYKNFPVTETPQKNLNIYRIKSNRKSEHEVGVSGLITFIWRGMFKISNFASGKKYDVIHYHFSVPTGLLTFFHDKLTPIAVTLHGIDVPGFHADEFPLFQKITKPFNKRVIHKASAIIAVSNNLKEKAEETFKNKHIQVIYHGVDVDKFKKLDIKKTESSVKFICVARLVKFKRIDVLLRAFKTLLHKTDKDVSLTIAGTGYMEDELKSLSAELGIQSNVEFAGYVSHETLPKLLNEHHVFVLPSVHDSFGIVYLEAMACGLCCIGANAAGVPEVVIHGQTGLLAKPESVESLSDCLLQLTLDHRLRKQMAENGFRLVHDKFTWEAIVEEYENVFNQIRK